MKFVSYGLTDRQTIPRKYAPSTFSKLGHKNICVQETQAPLLQNFHNLTR